MEPQRREHGLDWLRIFAFALLIFCHSGMIFVTWGFHIKNPELSRTLEIPMLFMNRWRLPLLFFISGCGAAFSLRRRGWGQFARERIQRLFIPVLFGMLVGYSPPTSSPAVSGSATSLRLSVPSTSCTRPSSWPPDFASFRCRGASV